MKKTQNIHFLLLSYLCFQYVLTQCTQVNPQPGENIWHLVAGIGTVVDELANNCTLTPLTISPQGTTISTAGTYCLTSDVILNDASTTIALSANNIVLDLNSHTITGTGGDIGAAIIINNGAQEVTVRNGTIQNASSGIFVDAFSSVININNIGFIESSVTGTGCSSVTLKNLIFDGPASHADFPDFGKGTFFAHVILFNAYNCVVDSCVSRGVVPLVTVQSLSYGYLAAQNNPIIPVESITFTNSTCSFFTDQINTNTLAAAFYSDLNNTICENCKVSGDGDGSALGFNLEPLLINPTESFITCFINNCMVENLPENNGFRIAPTASIPVAIIIQNCNVLRCNTGIEIDDNTQQSGFVNTVIKNCCAVGCTTGFLFELEKAASNVLMQYCIASACTDGFEYNAPQGSYTSTEYCTAMNCNTGFLVQPGANAIFAFNTATNNVTDYAGTAGAPPTPFSSIDRLFGDNLYN